MEKSKTIMFRTFSILGKIIFVIFLVIVHEFGLGAITKKNDMGTTKIHT